MGGARVMMGAGNGGDGGQEVCYGFKRGERVRPQAELRRGLSSSSCLSP